MKRATLFTKLPNQNVRCLACSWYCPIAPGRMGVCGTRLNKRGTLYSLVYGHAIGLHLDPVEKKPLHHFLPGSKLLSLGTVGCNFGCLFCQNWEMSQINKAQSLGLRAQISKPEAQSLLIGLIDKMSTTISPKRMVEMAIEEGADGIAYTYNEPAIFVEYAHDIAQLAKKKGLVNVYVSNGFESKEAFEYVSPYLDAINIDLKSFRSEFYLKICKGKLEPVKENIKRFFGAGIETEVTTLVIPGHNDSQEELSEIANFLVNISPDIPWHVSAFYPAYRMLDTPPTPHETLVRAYEIGQKAGLKYVYAGNVPDWERSSTYCPNCKALLIRRINYQVEILALDRQGGRCLKCQETIYGVWY